MATNTDTTTDTDDTTDTTEVTPADVEAVASGPTESVFPPSVDPEYIMADACIDSQHLVDELHAAAMALGRAPTRAEMNEFGEFAPSTYEKRFGSWVGAMEAAGVHVPARRRKKSGSAKGERWSSDGQ